MKMFVVFVILLHISQHALVLEVYKGVESVLLTCQDFSVPVHPTVVWSRHDLDPPIVHQRNDAGDELRGQNQRYRRRTSMKTDSLRTGDFSLTLRNPVLSDSGTYTCTITAYGIEWILREVELQVKVPLYALAVVEVEVYEGEKSVALPCYYSDFIPDYPTVIWTCNDFNPKFVHKQKEDDDFTGQNQQFSGRTSMRPAALFAGDLSLTLTKPNLTDSGTYTCSIDDGIKEKRLGEVQLLVKERIQSRPELFTGLLIGPTILFWTFFCIFVPLLERIDRASSSVKLFRILPYAVFLVAVVYFSLLIFFSDHFYPGKAFLLPNQ